MIFYKGNRADAPFEPDLAEVAAQFWTSREGRPHTEEPDYPVRLDVSLRLFLSNPHGFNSTWVDDTGYDELFTKVRETWPETLPVEPMGIGANVQERTGHIQAHPSPWRADEHEDGR